MQLPAQELVLGDLVSFTAGQQICADGVLRAGTLQVDESLLTGEADAIVKQPGDFLQSGSVVLSGTGLVELTQVGDQAFAARLTAEAKKDPKATRSEMMHALNRLIRVISIGLIPTPQVCRPGCYNLATCKPRPICYICYCDYVIP